MPPSAACLRSSSRTSPSAARPIGARRLCARGRGRQRSRVERSADGSPSRSTSRTFMLRPRSPSPPSASRSGVSVRGDRLAGAEVGLVEEHLGDRRRVLAPQLPRAGAALGHGEPRVDVRGLELARVAQQDQHALELARPREQLAEGRQLVGRMVGRGSRRGSRPARAPPAGPRARRRRSRRSGAAAPAAAAARARAARRARPSSGRTGSGPGRSGRRAGAAATSPTPRPRRRSGSNAVSSRTSCGARQAASWFISVRVHERARSRSPVTASTPTSARSTTTGSPRSVASALDQLARLLERMRLVLGERVHAEVEVDLAVQRHGCRCRAGRAGSRDGRAGAPRRWRA